MKEKLIELLTRHEGCKLHPYKDTKGLWTIGVGRCLETKGLTEDECKYIGCPENGYLEWMQLNGITQDQSDYLLSNDIDFFTCGLINSIVWFKNLPELAKIVLIDMGFNLGITGLLKFKNTLMLIQTNQYVAAAKEMLNSAWAKQVGHRAIELSEMLSIVK